MLEMVDLAHKSAIEAVEAALAGPVFAVGVAEVPLAHKRRAVARILQGLGQQEFVGGKPVGAAGGNDAHLQAVAHGITPGHQRGAGRRAQGLGIELGQLRAAGGEAVEVRGLDVGAVEAHVGEAEVVG